ncbi:carbohydrate porin [Asaia prunellae]|uniref:carbohydrate porin n=1 Tax=Asaia prunellae TaxID=610245 RepID=UPI0004700490|nr:carbohydrate porin [Asaia prunellae]
MRVSPFPKGRRAIAERRLTLGSGLLAVMVCGGIGSAAAQETNYTNLPSLDAQRAAVKIDDRCHDYDKMITKGSESPIITTCDTLFPDQFGLRDKLASKGILFEGYYSFGEIYDVLGHQGKPQAYNGQSPNFSGNLWLNMTYDMERVGLNKGSQLTLSMNNWQTAYPGAGIRGTALSQATIFQTFFNGRITAQYGYYGLLGQFYGLFLGTSTASTALGPTSIIPNQVGMSMYMPTPGLDIRMYAHDRRFYNHFGFARSQSPDGFGADSRANPSGVNFRVNGARPIYVDEIGFRQRPSKGKLMTWLRAGGIYNSSSYYDYRKRAFGHSNSAFYVVFDQQLIQTNPAIPYLGWYIDLKTDHADRTSNVFTDDYAATIYSLGPFRGHEKDMLSIGFTYNKIGSAAQQNLQQFSPRKFDHSTTSSIAYAAHLHRGIYFVGTTSYTTHPVVSRLYADALTLQGQFTLSF